MEGSQGSCWSRTRGAEMGGEGETKEGDDETIYEG